MKQPTWHQTLGLMLLLLGGCAGQQRYDLDTTICDGISGQDLGMEELKISNATLIENDSAYPPYCLVQGEVKPRQSPVDGRRYGIGFEMRLPVQWNGRFVHQLNGGSDGVIKPAIGEPLPASRHDPALQRGYAVLSSDSGHSRVAEENRASGLLQGSMFGYDPQARRDYGYSADQSLIQVANLILQRYYGLEPHYSYAMGCSNGGRHAMVDASRMPEQYDGYLVGDPGLNLPKAAIQHAWDVQSLTAADPSGDLRTSFTPQDLQLVAARILAQCDDLDGVNDGLVANLVGCQEHFDLGSLKCSSDKTDACLTEAQVTALNRSFAGPTDSQGKQLYTSWSWDPGIGGDNWRKWKIAMGEDYPIILRMGAASLATTFMTPPVRFPGDTADADVLEGFLQDFDFDTDAQAIYATDQLFTESAMDFMTMPDPHLTAMKAAGGKMIVYSGQADPVFAIDDLLSWYAGLDAHHQGRADEFVRLFAIPGMNHCSGGPALDSFDAFTALVNWVEHDQAPDSIEAGVDPQNKAAVQRWGTERTRPLCPWPKIAIYQGSGSVEDGKHFTCLEPTSSE